MVDLAENFRLLPPQLPGNAVQLDQFQQSIVNHQTGPLLVLAGPGTGKTTTLVAAIAARVKAGVEPQEILALTFSRKSAENLRDQVVAKIGRSVATPISATFHSFAYSLLRSLAPAELYAGPLRLLSATEQDVLLQEMLLGQGHQIWPDDLKGAIRTRGFAREVQAVLSRARERGLDPVDLAKLGEEFAQPALRSAALLMQRYAVVLDDLSATDYSDLMYRAVGLAKQHQTKLQQQYRHIFVDEYQDTDPSQEALLRLITTPETELVVVGDPNQAIYAFRGAEVRSILDFPTKFCQPDGTAAPVVVLSETRRFGGDLAAAAQTVASRIPLGGSIPGELQRKFLAPQPAAASPGQVQVLTFDNERAEAEHIADILRRAHLEDGIAWGEMAVLVRSGKSQLPKLRRSLSSAGVPVAVAKDETLLIAEPAIQPLLTALRLLNGDSDTETVQQLLLSPLAGLDATKLRVLARGLRELEKSTTEQPRSSAQLLASCLAEPAYLTQLAVSDSRVKPAAKAALKLADLLTKTADAVAAGAGPEQILWQLWNGSSWPQRLKVAALGTGPLSRAANRELDAVLALFELAGRFEQQLSGSGIDSFLRSLQAQQIPAETLAESGISSDSVRLLTAHRAKGLEWQLVVVAHVQEELWPDVRRRESLLPAGRISYPDLKPELTLAEILADERRLFYVAVTRAKQRLVVTAVAETTDDGEQPSRFLNELGVEVAQLPGRPVRPLTLASLVAELRRTLADPNSSLGLQQAAAHRLSKLSIQGVAAANPNNWWALTSASQSEQPIRPIGDPVLLRASALESLSACAARWFFEREAGGTSPNNQAQAFGLIVHALADRIAREDLPSDPGALNELMQYVDSIWGEINFRTPWSAAKEYAQMQESLTRLLEWHNRDRGREVVATEAELGVLWPLPDGDNVQLKGRVDRLEKTDAGNLVVVDLKTSKSKPTIAGVAEHDQLAMYQLVIDAGGAEKLLAGAGSAGAELVQLRDAPTGAAMVQEQVALTSSELSQTRIEERIVAAVSVIRNEEFAATPGKHCRYCDFQQICPAVSVEPVL